MSRPPSLWDQLSPESRALLFLLHVGSLAVVTAAYAWAATTKYPAVFASAAFLTATLMLVAAVVNYVRHRGPQ